MSWSASQSWPGRRQLPRLGFNPVNSLSYHKAQVAQHDGRTPGIGWTYSAGSDARRYYVDGCLRISAKACSRVESAGLFAVAALCSNDGAMPFNFARLLRLRCELSALWIAFRRAVTCSAGNAFDRDN